MQDDRRSRYLGHSQPKVPAVTAAYIRPSVEYLIVVLHIRRYQIESPDRKLETGAATCGNEAGRETGVVAEPGTRTRDKKQGTLTSAGTLPAAAGCVKRNQAEPGRGEARRAESSPGVPASHVQGEFALFEEPPASRDTSGSVRERCKDTSEATDSGFFRVPQGQHRTRREAPAPRVGRLAEWAAV
jgi:hypothetical protein